MLTRRNYAVLAGLTAVLFALAAAIGPDRDVIGNLDQVVFFGFLASVVLLIGSTLAFGVQALLRRRDAV